MSKVANKKRVALAKPYGDRLKRKEQKSLLSLGGVARGRQIGTGSEREYAKKTAARKIVREGV